MVRQPPSQDPNSHLYDYDLTTHVVLLSDWLHEDAMERFPGRLAANTGQDPESLLINGKGQFTVRIVFVLFNLRKFLNVTITGPKHRIQHQHAFGNLYYYTGPKVQV